MARRLFDILVAMVGLAVLSIPLAVILLLVWRQEGSIGSADARFQLGAGNPGAACTAWSHCHRVIVHRATPSSVSIMTPPN